MTMGDSSSFTYFLIRGSAQDSETDATEKDDRNM